MKPKLKDKSLKAGTGFTLIELLVVISIISLLASVLLVAVNDARQKAKVAKAKADIQTIYKALVKFRVDNGDTFDLIPWDACWVDNNWNFVPGGGTNNICTLAQWNSGWFSAYSGVPLDPWGHQYMVDGRPERAFGECPAGASSICSFGPNELNDGSVNNPAAVSVGDDICVFFEPEC